MRAFLAVEPSGEALGELQRAVGALHAPGLHPVRELHLTLRFFADIPEAKAAEMKSALRDVPGFGARLEASMQRKLQRGQLLRELLKQDRGHDP